MSEHLEVHRIPVVSTTSFLCSLHTPECNNKCKAFLALESQRRRHLATPHSLVTMPLSSGISSRPLFCAPQGLGTRSSHSTVQMVSTAVVDSCQDELRLATVSAASAPPQQDPRVHGWSRNRRLQWEPTVTTSGAAISTSTPCLQRQGRSSHLPIMAAEYADLQKPA